MNLNQSSSGALRSCQGPIPSHSVSQLLLSTHIWGKQILCFHESPLVLSNSASSPFITGHQLKPPSLAALQHLLLAERSPRQRPHTGVSRSSYRRQQGIRVLAFYRAFHAMALPSFRTFSFLPHCSCLQAPAVSIAFSTRTSFFLK